MTEYNLEFLSLLRQFLNFRTLATLFSPTFSTIIDNFLTSTLKKLLIFIERGERRGRGRASESESERLVVPLMYASLGYFLCVPWKEIEPSTLEDGDDVQAK